MRTYSLDARAHTRAHARQHLSGET